MESESEYGTFGDIRDKLVRLPHNPWNGFGGSYVIADLFPIRWDIVRDVNPRRVFEFGGYLGYCLVTMLDAAPDCEWLGWSDHDEPAGELCCKNIASYLDENPRPTIPELTYHRHVRDVARAGIRADVVAVDGDHRYQGCLADLTMALEMRPKVILVDDYTAISSVREATHDFCEYFALEPVLHTTVNGLAEIRT